MRLARPSSSVALALGAALMPKCPLCVAAALSTLGVGAAVADTVAPWMRPATLAIALAIAVVALSRVWNERRARRIGACCARR